ncbi:sensor histidine kinase [Tundrisphaera lichenicola]|uniref:sensor histidine kinase n=1 Tax=Tundrisphaera lichenicola TaxID=2029860 RepID=UPI003EBFECA1
MSRNYRGPKPWIGRRSRPVAGLLMPLWVGLVILAIGLLGAVWGRSAVSIILLGLAALTIGLLVGRSWERSRWSRPVRSLARSLEAFNAEPDQSSGLPGSHLLSELIQPLRMLQSNYLRAWGRLGGANGEPLSLSDSGEMSAVRPLDARMTRSGSYEPPSELAFDPASSAEFSTLDMINRLEPRTFRWLDSSVSEQLFLGWSMDQLRDKSFLEIVQEDDRELARQQLRASVARGEGHGMIYRIETARGEVRAVELNVGVRYGPDGRILHLRCHLADVTAKLQDETELRRRTQELIQANDQLRRTNRQVEELKDRYGDLYQNAPAMYLSVDRRGNLLECNETMFRTLGLDGRELLNRPCGRFFRTGRGPSLAERLAEASRTRPIEFEAEWIKANGETIYVWVTGSAVLAADGKVRHFRCVAQDITARRSLEAELQVKNERLAQANAELSIRNKELDEFTYVVSHDLQEPLRTLIAFSDFLMRDQGERLDEAGREHVRYLVEASRRMRALIQDLLALSRAGSVTGDFARVDLEELVEVVKADHGESIRSKNAEVRVEGRIPPIWGDRDRLGQLLANLIGNGLKYNTSPNPLVSIEATQEGPGCWVTLRVTDNGIGIDPSFHQKIFQIFRRLHTREEYEGTGAGLAICQKIVQAHGGRIWVESQPGCGSNFHVTLPGIAREAAGQPEVVHES